MRYLNIPLRNRKCHSPTKRENCYTFYLLRKRKKPKGLWWWICRSKDVFNTFITDKRRPNSVFQKRHVFVVFEEFTVFQECFKLSLRVRQIDSLCATEFGHQKTKQNQINIHASQARSIFIP